jgi:hypothetical protein
MMQSRQLQIAVVVSCLLGMAGCANSNVVANNSSRSGQFFDDFGITGNNNVVTIEQWSKLTKLSIIGDGNEVIVEEGVRLPMIEVFGSDNVISVPDYLIVQMNQVGDGNRLVQRQTQARVQDTTPMYRPPPRRGYDRVRVTIENERGETTTTEMDADAFDDGEEIRIPPPPTIDDNPPAKKRDTDEVDLEITPPPSLDDEME